MAFSRVAALRSAIRAVRPSIARPQTFRQVARRTYASGHGSAQAGSDLWWGVGAVGITIPTCWYILSNAPEPAHGHGDHGDGHGEEHEEEHEEKSEDESKDEAEEETKDDGKDDGEDKDEEASVDAEAKDSEKSEDSDSGDDEKNEADTPETSDDEDAEDSTEKKEGGNTKKSIPDAKGGKKKRLESNNAIKAGENEGPDAAASKTAGSQNTQSGKQEGLTNTDTKHSTDISNDPSKSKKAEGGPDTAKLKGTVDPNRPQSEKK